MELGNTEQILMALAENDDQPHGPARTARAEEITAAAEALGDPSTLVSALAELIEAYEYGAEHAKGPVAFARLLRLLDTHPDSFSPYQLYSAHWYFKWITGFMIDISSVPLTSMTAWITEMERRYKLAGYSMRTVAAQNLRLFLHTGDSARAERALQDMLTLPRDQMSDCPACEDRLVGEAHLQAGQDGKALKAWADVLTGKRTCQEEPHIILSMSLLPLLRLGRGEEASANHTRGYQIARGNTNLSGAIGRHLEFCALTGNVGRGLEILADSRPMLTAVTDPLPRLELLAGVAVLLRRLAATGYGGVPLFSGTAGELAGQVTTEATEIAAGFDARNGTTGVSDELRQRLDREPFGSIVRLGRPEPRTAQVNPPAPHDTAPDNTAPDNTAPDNTGPDNTGPDDLDSLVAHARSLSVSGHPGARIAWARIAELTAGSPPPDELLAGELAQEQAMAATHRQDWSAAAAGLKAATGHFAAADQPGRAVAAAARAEWVATQLDPRHDPWPILDAHLARARQLLAEDQPAGDQPAGDQPAGDQGVPRDLLVVRHTRALLALEALTCGGPAERPATAARFAAEAQALIADAREHDVPWREAAAEILLASAAQLDGDPGAEATRLRRAVELMEQAGRPWDTAGLRCRLGQLMIACDDPAAAASLLEEAITTATQWPQEEFLLGRTHMMLAAAYQDLRKAGLAVANARMGLACFVRDGNQLAAAHARSDLGLVLTQAGHLDEAGATLEEAIPQLAELAGAEAAARSRITLAHCLRQGGDHRGAAQQFALAAETFEGGRDTDAYLFSAAEVALSLAEAGLWPEAHQAYDRALALAETKQRWSLLVRMHRELAQVAVRDGLDDAPARALRHVEQALAAGDKAGAEGGNCFEAARERGLTCCQACRALDHAQRHAEALSWLERGIAELAADDACIDDLVQATHLAASIEAGRLGRVEAARQRLTAVIERCTALGHERAATALSQLADRVSAGTTPG